MTRPATSPTDVLRAERTRMELELIPLRPEPYQRHTPITPRQAADNRRLLEAALASISAQRTRARAACRDNAA
jgi:hypothetical protein